MAMVDQVVTELTIDASGATRGGAEYERVMQRAAATSMKSVTLLVDSAAKNTAAWNRVVASLGPVEKAHVDAQNAIARATAISDKAVKQGVASQEQAAALIARITQQHTAYVEAAKKAAGANDNVAKSTGLARYELINLSRQLQDVATMAALGAPPMQILASQGAQFFDIFASSEGTLKGFFSQIVSGAASALTPLRLIAGGVAAIATAGVAATASWSAAQRQIDMSLTGIGRASGVTRAGVNAVGSQVATPTGLSIAEARETAAALAATGKIGAQNLELITGLAQNFAIVMGTDATGAAKALAAAFADPIKGAEELNKRLGFLDLSMKRQIESLTRQNNLYAAQRVLAQGIASSTSGAGQQQGFFGTAWNATSNFASNRWTMLGQNLAGATGIGRTLEDQIAGVRKELELVDKYGPSVVDRIKEFGGATPAVDRLRESLSNLEKQLASNATRADLLAAAQTGLEKISPVYEAMFPEDAQRRAANDVATFLKDIKSRVDREFAASGESPFARALGLTQSQISEMTARAVVAGASIRTAYQTFSRSAAIDRDAIGDRPGVSTEGLPRRIAIALPNSPNWTPPSPMSPEGRGLYAARRTGEIQQESLRRGTISEIEVAKMAMQNYILTRKEAEEKNAEAARTQQLGARQATEAAQLEANMVGKNAAEQERLRQTQAARFAAEQQAAAQRIPIDEATLKAIQAQIDAQARLNQLLQERRVVSDLNFERSQLGRGEIDQNVASRLRGIYGDDYTKNMDGPIAAQIRLNEQLKLSKDLATDFATGFTSDFVSSLRNGANAWESFAKAGLNALTRLSDKLLDMAVRDLVSAAFGGKNGGGGLFGSLLGGLFGGGGGGPFSFGAGGYTGFGPFLAANGGIMTSAGPLPLNRYAGGGVANSPQMAIFGEGRRPEAYVPLPDGRSIPVTMRTPQQQHWNSAPSVSYRGGDVIIHGNADQSTIVQLKAELDRRDRATDEKLRSLVAGEPARRRSYEQRIA